MAHGIDVNSKESRKSSRKDFGQRMVGGGRWDRNGGGSVIILAERSTRVCEFINTIPGSTC